MLRPKIESILFLAARPLHLKRLAELAEADTKDVEIALKEIQESYNQESSGVKLFQQGKEYQLATAPAVSELVAKFLQEEVSGELTRPSLEALTIIAYRGPITKPELEQIRGVNCSLILRNLLIRGLIQEEADAVTKMVKFSVTIDFLKHLGVQKIEDLPDYGRLHADQVFNQVLEPTINL